MLRGTERAHVPSKLRKVSCHKYATIGRSPGTFDPQSVRFIGHRVYVPVPQQDTSVAHAPSPSYHIGLPTGSMNTKIIFTRSSPVRTVLVNEATGQELYRIDTPRRVVGSVTRVFRRDAATPPASNLTSDLTLESDESRGSDERNSLPGARSDDRDEENGNEGNGHGVEGAEEGAVGEESPLVENEIARWYWKWFSSPRMVFEGKISTRAEYMPFKGKLRA